MRLFKVIIVLSSLLFSNTALAGSSTPGDTKGTIGDMPAPILLDLNDLKSIGISISIILGSKDRLVDLKAVDKFSDEVPSEIFTINEGGHFLFFEQPDELSKLIVKII